MRRTVLAVICAVCAVSAAVAQTGAADAGTYRIGAASVVMTPKVSADAPPVWLAGYGMGRQAESAHDDVYARAMFIHDGHFGLAIVACDLIGLFRDEVLDIREEVGKLSLNPPIDYILVSSTHTHAGPDTLGIWGPVGRSGITPGYLKKVRASCVEAIRRAHRTARPGTLRIATADVNKTAELIGDSRRPIVIDSKLTVIQARDETGKTIVTLVNMPCHPEVLGGRNHQLSSDFPSTERQYLEEKLGGLAIHDSGSVGGLLSPRRPKNNPFSNEPLPQEPIEQMMAYGRIIGRIAETALAQAEPLSGPVRARSKEVLIPVWNVGYRLAMGIGTFERPIFDAQGREVPLPKPAASQEATSRPAVEDPYLKTEVALVEIGPLQIAGIPGELYPEIALGEYQRPQEPNADYPGAPLEPAIFPLMTGRYKMIIGLANDEIGYIIPKSQWDWLAPYAYGRSDRQYGEINSCGPEVAPRLTAAWESLIKGKGN
jgi:hypothetical protein